MPAPIRTVVRLVAAVAGAAVMVACAKLATIDAAEPVTRSGAEPEDASLVVDGSLVTPEGVTISPAELTLGALRCGESQSGTITITNNGVAAVPYEVVLTNNTTFTLRGAPSGTLTGTVERGDFVIVHVDAAGVIPGAAATDVVVKAGASVQQISAKLDVKGALLTVTPPLVDFGDVRKQTVSNPAALELKNEGNEPVTITGFSGLTPDFQVSTATVTIAPASTATIDATLTAGNASDTAVSTVLTPQTLGAICAAAPSVTLKGRRVNDEVTVGPLAADLGDFNCGVAPAAQAKIAVTNYSTSLGAKYEAKLLSPASRFKIVSGGVGTIGTAANVATPASADVVIGANAIALPLGEFDEDLEVKITEPLAAAVTKTVKLHIGAYGAIIVVEPPSLSGFAINETKAFAITNIGNRRTCVRYSDVQGNGYFIEADDELRPGEKDDLRVQFAARSSGTYDYTITLTHINCAGENGPICVPPPSPTVSATR